MKTDYYDGTYPRMDELSYLASFRQYKSEQDEIIDALVEYILINFPRE